MTNLEKIQLYQELVDQVQRESLRPVCRLRLSREPFGVTDSHLGGVPYVPREGQIPFQELFCAALEARLPGADPKEFDTYRLRSDDPEEREALDRLEKQTQRGGCKIGGHPRYYQCDPRENPYRGMSEESLKQYSISPEQVRQALAQTAWDTLLFQLDDDDSSLDTLEDMDLYLGGCGSINFLIRSEDLKNRDFSHLLAQWACT